MREISGVIENIIFKNNENGYCVLELTTNDDENTVVVGYFHEIAQGGYITVKGDFVFHSVYGEQFKAETYECSKPQDIDGIRAYLASGAVSGVRAGLATRIINEFGENSLIIMENEPEKLSRVKGISLKKAQEISNRLKQDSHQREAVIFMQSYGITSAMAIKIYEKYEDEVYHIIKTNPYELAERIQGIGFRTADAIAEKVGIDKGSETRILSGIIYALRNAISNGHIFLPIHVLQNYILQLLDIECETIDAYITNLAMDKKLIVKKTEEEVNVYIASLYYMEQTIAFMLSALNIDFDIDTNYYIRQIDKIEKEDGIIPDDNQRQAVLQAVSSGLLVITGGPGTGKTTVLKTIIKLFEEEGLEIALTAPTGRAAKRMSEATNRSASTIHRLLEVRVADKDGTAIFERNRDNPLEADVVIVDEMSMVDVSLMHSLLSAIPVGCRLILTGDTDQLPSVGAGNVLKDMIASGRYKTVVLDKIFRQEALSNIVVNAHRINKGEVFFPTTLGADFVFLERNDVKSLQLAILIMIKNKIPTAMNLSPFDIQVLCPMKKGAVGIEGMNKLLQRHLNPPDDNKKEHQTSTTLYREGDKVMQVKNNYQIDWEIKSKSGFIKEKGSGIFNGDIGVINSINEFSSTITVCFDDEKIVEYPFSALGELELAYAITIHKSQGSEYKVVILPLFSGSRMIMTRNILYTAITRAKLCVCMVGRAEVFAEMIDNVGEAKRYSSLKDRIEEVENIRKNN